MWFEMLGVQIEQKLFSFYLFVQVHPLTHKPCAVASSTEDRDFMINCLQLGAADYMMKPLRPAELRNLWARVYWWRRVTLLKPCFGQDKIISDATTSITLYPIWPKTLNTSIY